MSKIPNNNQSIQNYNYDIQIEEIAENKPLFKDSFRESIEFNCINEI